MNEVASQKGSTPQNFSIVEVKELAKAAAESRLFGVKTYAEAFSLMMLSQAERMHPMMAARDYHIIDGKPSLKAEVVLARFQQAGGTVEWIRYDEIAVVGKFTAPGKGGAVTISWSIERASKITTFKKDGKQFFLTDKDNWKNYPAAQMRSRCISEGVKTVAPWVFQGFYLEEEVADMVDLSDRPGTSVSVEPPVAVPPTPAADPYAGAVTGAAEPMATVEDAEEGEFMKLDRQGTVSKMSSLLEGDLFNQPERDAWKVKLKAIDPKSPIADQRPRLWALYVEVKGMLATKKKAQEDLKSTLNPGARKLVEALDATIESIEALPEDDQNRNVPGLEGAKTADGSEEGEATQPGLGIF